MVTPDALFTLFVCPHTHMLLWFSGCVFFNSYFNCVWIAFFKFSICFYKLYTFSNDFHAVFHTVVWFFSFPLKFSDFPQTFPTFFRCVRVCYHERPQNRNGCSLCTLLYSQNFTSFIFVRVCVCLWVFWFNFHLKKFFRSSERPPQNQPFAERFTFSDFGFVLRFHL